MNIHIITGGSSGIGFEIAKTFKNGLVIIASRGEDGLKKAKKALKKEGAGAEVDYHTVDVSDKESIKELFEYAKEKGDIKTVVNSAGMSGTGGKIDLVLKVDLLGTKLITDAAYEYMKKGGVLINIASMMGHIVPASEEYVKSLTHPDEEGALLNIKKFINDDANIAYNFAKRGVIEIVKENAMKFGEKGLRIVSVSPGIIMTEMAKDAQKDNKEIMDKMVQNTPAGRTGEPEDIAKAVHFLASKKASFITGTDLLVDGGLSLNLAKMYQ